MIPPERDDRPDGETLIAEARSQLGPDVPGVTDQDSGFRKVLSRLEAMYERCRRTTDEPSSPPKPVCPAGPDHLVTWKNAQAQWRCRTCQTVLQQLEDDF